MKYGGFTLIELLVVIVIITLLIALVLPALGMAKKQAESVVCASNVKHLFMSIQMYEQENKTCPPGFDDSFNYVVSSPPGGYVGPASHDRQGWWWFHFLDDLLESSSTTVNILRCPSRNIVDTSLKENLLCGNYGVNRSVCKNAIGVLSKEFVGTSLSLDDIRQPGQTLLIADSGYSIVSWYAVADGVAVANIFENPMRIGNFYIPGLSINKDRTFTNGCEQDAIDGRHPGRRINVGFVDGHVDKIKADELEVKEENGEFINRSPLWIPK